MRLYGIAGPALLASVMFGPWCTAETVVRVKDGDSLVVDSNGREVEVRLADIDTPEYNQPRGGEGPGMRCVRWSTARRCAWNSSGETPIGASWRGCSSIPST